jgi:ribosomal protein S2
VSSGYYSQIVVKEALNAQIPCMAIIDTNFKGISVTMPIPGNDEGFYIMIFYNNIVSNFILLKKFFLFFL